MARYGLGTGAGLAAGYLVAREGGLHSSDWKPLVYGTGIGALMGRGVGLTVGVVDVAQDMPGRSHYIMRDMALGVGFGAALRGHAMHLCFGILTLLSSGALLVSASSPAQAAGQSADGGQTCPGRLKTFRVWLEKLQAESAKSPWPFPGSLGVRLVEHQAGPVSAAPVVELFSGRIRAEGQSFADGSNRAISFEEQLARLDSFLANEAKVYGLLHPKDAPTRAVAVAVDREVPWKQIVALVARLAKVGRTEVDWLFATSASPGLTPPPHSSLDRELEAAARDSDPSQKAATLGTMAEGVFARCPAAHEAFVYLANVAPKEKLPILAERLPAALENCQCAIELEALQALLFAIWGRPPSAPTYSEIHLRLAGPNAQRSKSVASAAETPWSDAFRLLVDAAGTGKEIALRTAAPSAKKTHADSD